MGTTLNGACHCGATKVALQVDDVSRLSPRHCGCGFCRRHRGMYVSAPDAELDITISGPDAVNRYNFGHSTADFLICRTCGVMPAVTCEIEGNLYGIVNANTLDPPLDVDPASVPVMDYDAENIGGRLDRRAERWIGTVRVHTG